MESEIKEKEQDEILQLVSFKVGTEEFAIDILKVNEIIRFMEITKIPNSPVYVEGIINLRGKVVPVVDLRIKMGLPPRENDSDSRIIVVELHNKVIGFKVDAVYEVLRIPRSITETPPEMVSNVDSQYITSVGKIDDRLLILLDIEKMLLEI
jgi:purine-binding chemotaxis protein CheW